MIKSNIILSDKKEAKYPCLMKSNNGNDVIVLFTTQNTGMVVNFGKDSSYKVGNYRFDWISNTFDVFDGEIRLKNEE
jgi:hypothetical protein